MTSSSGSSRPKSSLRSPLSSSSTLRRTPPPRDRLSALFFLLWQGTVDDPPCLHRYRVPRRAVPSSPTPAALQIQSFPLRSPLSASSSAAPTMPFPTSHPGLTCMGCSTSGHPRSEPLRHRQSSLSPPAPFRQSQQPNIFKLINYLPKFSKFDNPSSYEDRVIATGLPASPGVAVDQVVFTVEDAETWHAQGKPVILMMLFFK